MVEGLFGLLFYCEGSINQYAGQKTVTDVFGASLLLPELSCFSGCLYGSQYIGQAKNPLTDIALSMHSYERKKVITRFS